MTKTRSAKAKDNKKKRFWIFNEMKNKNYIVDGISVEEVRAKLMSPMHCIKVKRVEYIEDALKLDGRSYDTPAEAK